MANRQTHSNPRDVARRLRQIKTVSVPTTTRRALPGHYLHACRAAQTSSTGVDHLFGVIEGSDPAGGFDFHRAGVFLHELHRLNARAAGRVEAGAGFYEINACGLSRFACCGDALLAQRIIRIFHQRCRLDDHLRQSS